MSDIFLSYARVDRETAAALAGALERHGWSVWWDSRIPTGKDYADVIEAQLTSARCVIVLWSKKSAASGWVKTEAADALDRGLLVPVLIEPVRPPLEFRRIQAADLTGWKGEQEHAGLAVLVGDLTGILGAPAGAAREGVEAGAVGRAGVRPVDESAVKLCKACSFTLPDGAEECPVCGGRRFIDAADAPQSSVAPAAEPRRPDAGGASAGESAREQVEEADGARRPPALADSVASALPKALKYGVTAAVLVGLVFIVAKWGFQSSDNLNSRNERQSNMQSPTPHAEPTATPVTGNDNGTQPTPKQGAAQIGLLLKQLNADDEQTRSAAVVVLKERHASDPKAVERAIELLDRAAVGELSQQGLVNVLSFLNSTTDRAWPLANFRKVLPAFNKLARADLGVGARAEMESFRARLMRLPYAGRDGAFAIS